MPSNGATSAGQVSIDLILNSAAFQSQITAVAQQSAAQLQKTFDGMSANFSTSQKTVRSEITKTTQSTKGLTSAASGMASGFVRSAGRIVAAFLSVKTIMNAISAGSDLTEAQNVTETVFSSMTDSVEQWAASMLDSAGLTRTMALKYAGTFGAMAKSFGFAEDEAFNMSSTLAQLSGDVASFYNLSQDEAFGKLKGIFTGETESLKSLGIVMTQAALDQYALANGYGRTTANMSEAEKVMLRYAFVQDRLNAASGDFLRTQDSWANQIKRTKGYLQEIMASFGQGLINLFLPTIKVVNSILAKIAQLAEAFKGLTELITGKKSKSGAGVGLTDTLPDTLIDTGDYSQAAASGLNDVGDAATKTGNAAAKAAKQMRTLLGFDEINKLQEVMESVGDVGDSGSGSGSGKGTAPGSGVGLGLGKLGTAATDFGQAAQGDNKQLAKLAEWLEKIKNLCAPTTDAIKRLWNEGLAKLGNFSLGVLKDFYRDFLVPVGTWMLNDNAGLPRFFNITNNLLNNINWDRLRTKIDGLFIALDPLAKLIWTSLMDFYGNFLSPVATWTCNKMLPTFIGWVTEFARRIDWTELSRSLGLFWTALSKFTIGIGDGLIGFFDELKPAVLGLATIAVKGTSAALTGLSGALHIIADSGVAEVAGGSIGGVIAVLLGFKSVSFVTKVAGTIAAKLSGLAGAAGTLGAGTLGIAAFVGGALALHHQLTTNDLTGEMNDLTQAIKDTKKALKGNEIQNGKDYQAIIGIVDRFAEINGKLLNGEAITSQEKQLWQLYYEKISEYAPDIVEKIDTITGAYKGTREELIQLINTQYVEHMLTTYEDAIAELSTEYGEASKLIQDALSGIYDEVTKNGGSVQDYENIVKMMMARITHDYSDLADFYGQKTQLMFDSGPVQTYVDQVTTKYQEMDSITVQIGEIQAKEDAFREALLNDAGTIPTAADLMYGLIGDSAKGAADTTEQSTRRMNKAVGDIPNAVAGVSDEVVKIANDVPPKTKKAGEDAVMEYTGGFLSGRQDAETAASEVTTAIQTELESEKAPAETTGRETSSQYTGGFLSGRQDAETAAKEVTGEVEAEMDDLSKRAPGFGGIVSMGFGAGIHAKISSPIQEMQRAGKLSLIGLNTELGVTNGESAEAKKSGAAVMSGLSSGTTNNTPGLLGLFTALPGSMKKSMGDLVKTFMAVGDLIARSMYNGLVKAQMVVTNQAAAIASATYHAFDGVPGRMYSTGVSAAQNYAAGLRAVHIPTPHFGVGTGWASAAGQVFPIPQVSMAWLAQGGYVARNTPRLAVIGDNTREGEIVAPESKLQAMADQAANGSGINRVASLLETLISLVRDGGDIVLDVDGTELARANAKGSARLQRRYTAGAVSFS